MADVGILNLQINDNSDGAIAKLEKLEGVLVRIKAAVQSVTGLSTVANGIRKLAEAVNEGVQDSTIEKIERITAALGKLQGLGEVTLKVAGAGSIKRTMDTIQEGQKALDETMEAVRPGTEAAGNEFDGLTERISEAGQAATEMRDRIGDIGETAGKLDFSQFDPSRIPLGALGMKVGSAVHEIIRFGDALKETTQIVQQLGAGNVMASVNEMSEATQQVTQNNEVLEQSWNHVGEEISEAAGQIRDDYIAAIDESTRARAREAEEIRRQQEERFYAGTQKTPYTMSQTNMMAENLTQLDLLRAQLREAEAEYNHFVNTVGAGSTKAVSAGLKVGKLREEIAEYTESMRVASQASGSADTVTEKVGSMTPRIGEAAQAAQNAQGALNLSDVLTQSAGGSDKLNSSLKELDVELRKKKQDALAAAQAFERLEKAGGVASPAMQRLTGALSAAGGTGDTVTGAMGDETETLKSRLSGLAGAGNAAKNALNLRRDLGETAGSASTATSRLKNLDNELKRKKTDAEGARGAFDRFREGISRLLGPIAKLLNSFKRIIMYRIIRSILKNIVEGFREGVENVYRYSKAIGKDFAPAMDSAASSLAQMKNAIGAAAAPVIQALIPLMQTLVGWFIQGINYLNQFFALLRGQKTWTRALPQTVNAFDKTSKAAKGASAAVKDLLADWDELNIIQSESNGGGGGGSAKQAADYLHMFEEVSVFNDKVQRVVDFIEKHLGGVLGLAKDIGLAILAWHISEAFGGLLGQLARIAAGAIFVKIGLQLSYGSGFEAGLKGYFDAMDVLGVVAGTIATAFGGSVIGTAVAGPMGGVVGALIGMTVGIVASFIGYIDGENDRIDAFKWGENSMTPEEVHDYVIKQFNFDIEAQINTLDAVITNQAEAKRLMNAKIAAFSSGLNKVRIAMDGTPEGINAAAESFRSVINQIKGKLDNSEKTIEILGKLVPFKGEDGKDQTDTFLGSITLANDRLSAYFEGIGKQIAYWVDLGQKNEWKNNEAQMVVELMEHQANILEGAERARIARSYEVDAAASLAGMTRDTAEAVMAEQIRLADEYREKMKEAYMNEAKEMFWYADLADAAGLLDENGNPLSAIYTAAAEELLSKIESGDIYKEFEPGFYRMKEQWIKTLQEVYGVELGNASIDTFGMTDVFRQWLGLGTYFEDEIQNALKEANPGQAASDIFKRYLEGLLGVKDPHGIIQKAASTFGFTVFDIMPDEIQKQAVAYLRKAAGNDAIARVILETYGLSSDKVSELLGIELPKVIEVVQDGKDAVLREMELAGWQSMEDDDFQGFIRKLIASFGENDVRRALEDLDIPMGDAGIEAIDDAEAAIKARLDMVDWETATDEEFWRLVDVLNATFGNDAVLKALDSYPFPWLEFEDETGAFETEVDTIVEDAKQAAAEVEEAFKGIHVVPDIQLSNEALVALRMVENAANSGKGLEEINKAVSHATTVFGQSALTEALPYIQQVIEMYKQLHGEDGGVSGAARPKWATVARVGYSDANYGSPAAPAGVAPGTDVSEDMEQGVRRGNDTQNDLIQQLINIATRIANKDFVVNVTPSSGWAEHTSRSSSMFERVTG